jgi:eukaryotic translation initiation factor 2C
MTTRPNSNAYFDRAKGTTMTLQSTGGLLEARRGIFQTVQIRFSRLTVNVDTATSVFWAGKPLIECVCGLMGGLRPDGLETAFRQDPARFSAVCTKMLGMFFVVKHLPNQDQKTRKIKFQGWSHADARGTIFEEQLETETKSTSVFDYFREKYGIVLRWPSLPLVHSRRGDFPLELCFSAADERYKSVLEGAETADFIRFATAGASVRRQQINHSLRILAWHNQETIKIHGLSVSPQQLEVKGLVLPAPRILYGAQAMAHPQDGQWNLRGLSFLRPSCIKAWASISFAGQVDERFGFELLKGFRAVGLSVPNQPPALLVGNPNGDIKQIVNNAIQKATQTFGAPPDLILVLLPKASIPLYVALKSALDIHYGIASQVMLAEKALKERGQAQYIANIAMKVNVKLGGTNCTIDEPLFKKDRYMLIGGDLSLAGPSAIRRDPVPPASSALVGTWDKSCTAYSSISSMQPSTYVNIVVNAALMFKELLNRYKERNNGLLPQRIIYYRDGASESEFDGILKQEGLALRALCKDSGTKITIVVAIKRHHTRFFAEGELATQLGNVPPGTVIENSPDRNDCFIVSHKDLQGTKRPTFYRVLVDENALTADDFNRLTYGLCSTYARATTSVAVWLVSECVIAIWRDLLIL